MSHCHTFMFKTVFHSNTRTILITNFKMKTIIYVSGFLFICITSVCAFRSFTFEIKNVLKDPKFQHNMVLPMRGQEPLIRYMELAVNMYNKEFNGFTATYFRKMGYFINAINKVSGNYTLDKTSWSFVDGKTGKLLPVGVSSYYPKPFDHIIANFTVWSHQ